MELSYLLVRINFVLPPGHSSKATKRDQEDYRGDQIVYPYRKREGGGPVGVSTSGGFFLQLPHPFLSHSGREVHTVELNMAELKEGFHRVEFQNTLWEVPARYQDLRAIGIGAFGSVW